MIDILFANSYRLYFGYNIHDSTLYEHQRVERLYRVKSDIYDHGFISNADNFDAAWGHIEYKISTESLGFKSKASVQTPLSTDNHRILFIGDSFTEGVGVSYEETFVGLIADRVEGSNIEVLNAAVTSYSPQIYFNKTKYLLEEVGLKFDELVVFIDISDVLDEVNMYQADIIPTQQNLDSEGSSNPSEDQLAIIDAQVSEAESTIESVAPRTTGIKKWMSDNSVFGYMLVNMVYDSFKVRKDGYNLNMRQSLWTIDDKVYDEYAEAGLILSKQYMNLLRDLLIEHEVGLTIAVYPWPDQIVNNDLHSIEVTYWQDWSKQKEVKFLNFFPDFINDECAESCRYQVLKDDFIYGDVHWNERGHEIVAEHFLATRPDLISN